MRKLLNIFLLTVTTHFICLSFVSAEQHISNNFKESHADFFHLFFAERTDLRAGYLYEMDAKGNETSPEYQLQNAFIEGLFQAQVSRDSFVSIGVNLGARRYHFSGGNDPKLDSDDLYKVAFTPGYGTFINDDFLIWGQLELGSYSDLDRGPIQSENYQALGNIQLVYRLNPGAQLLAGISYSNDYLEQRLLPFVGLRLMSDTGAFQLVLDLPFKARAGYYLNPHIETFAQVVAKGDRYRVRTDGEDFNVGVHDERAGIGLRFWLGNQISLTFEGGRTLNSEFKFYTDTPQHFYDGDIDPHWFVQSYLGIAF